jgi:hypothetical protein
MNVLRNGILGSVLASFALLGACGGGGGQDANAPTNTAASASAAPSAAPSADMAASTTTSAPSAAPVASAAPTPSAAPSAPPGPPAAGDWDKWSHDWKLAYMKSDVMPKMGEAFKAFDAKRYADFKCKTCHGAGAEDGSFKMPNPALPKLDVKGGLKTEKAKHPKSVEFMMKKVEIQMAALLGEQPFDMKTMKGFGCAECHTTNMK